jgi:rRNA-processing protein EBP2
VSAIVASRSACTASLRALVTEVQFVEQQEQEMDRFAGTRRGDESSDESDADAEDALERRALAEARLARAAKPERRAASKAKRAFSDRPGLERCRIIPEDAPFVETLILTATQPLIAPSDNDDLKREVGFYDLALTLAREGRNKLTELGEPVRRPKDFFCEMVKSDQHMARVKESLVVQQKKISAVEKRKAEKAQKKYAKQVQAEAEAEKSERKKKRLREIDDWRKESQKRGRDLDERPRKFSRTQKTKDKKWGFGGVKRGSKKTTDRRDKSLSDLKDFNPTRGKAKLSKKKGRGKGGKGRR